MRIGIFFIVDGVLVSDTLSVEQCLQFGEHVEYGAHYDYWSKLEPTTIYESAFKSHAYDYYPRGRIVLDVKHHQVKLYVDHCIDTEALTNISTAFALPNNALVRYDEHYQCHRCNQMFIDDFDEMDE